MSILKFVSVIIFSFSIMGFGQNDVRDKTLSEEKRLFDAHDLLPIKLKYSRKNLKK